MFTSRDQYEPWFQANDYVHGLPQSWAHEMGGPLGADGKPISSPRTPQQLMELELYGYLSEWVKNKNQGGEDEEKDEEAEKEETDSLWDKVSDFFGGHFGVMGDLANIGMDGLSAFFSWLSDFGDTSTSNQYDSDNLSNVFDMFYGDHGIGHPEHAGMFFDQNSLEFYYDKYAERAGELGFDVKPFEDWHRDIQHNIDPDGDGDYGTPGGGTGGDIGDEDDDEGEVGDVPGGGDDDPGEPPEPPTGNGNGTWDNVDPGNPFGDYNFPTTNWWDAPTSGPLEGDQMGGPRIPGLVGMPGSVPGQGGGNQFGQGAGDPWFGGGQFQFPTAGNPFGGGGGPGQQPPPAPPMMPGGFGDGGMTGMPQLPPGFDISQIIAMLMGGGGGGGM